MTPTYNIVAHHVKQESLMAYKNRLQVKSLPMKKSPEHGKKRTRKVPALVVGKRLALARDAAGLSQAELARRLRVSPSKLSNWENGIAMLPGEFVPKIFLITRIDANYLFLGDTLKLPSDIERKLAAAEEDDSLPSNEKARQRKR